MENLLDFNIFPIFMFLITILLCTLTASTLHKIFRPDFLILSHSLFGIRIRKPKSLPASVAQPKQTEVR